MLLAGAVRHKKPDKIVFVKEANMDRRFQDWSELLSGVELARLLMSTPHFCDMARSVDFPPLAEERVQRHRRRCAGISHGTAPKILLAAPARPSNRAARGRAL